MNEKPDNGAIVDQCAVPILIDDTAHEVFGKVVVAAEIVLARSLPRMLDGTATERAQDLSQGRYFGGRKPEDGRIPAERQRAADPQPGARARAALPRRLLPRRRRAHPHRHAPASPNGRKRAPGAGLRLCERGRPLWLLAADGSTLDVLAAQGA